MADKDDMVPIRVPASVRDQLAELSQKTRLPIGRLATVAVREYDFSKVQKMFGERDSED